MHVIQICDKTSELASVEDSAKKKPGPKSRTRIRTGGKIKAKSQIPNLRIEEEVDDPGAIEDNEELDIPVCVKQELVSKENVINPKLKSKPRKKKSKDVATDEYTCFNPTFKIKPGTKMVAKTKAKTKINLAISVPVPEIKLTFNLDDLGFVAQEINLQDLSAAVKPQIDKKRKDRSKDFPEVKRLKVEKLMREMTGGIDDEEHQDNISSDGSEAPLVMDLDQEL